MSRIQRFSLSFICFIFSLAFIFQVEVPTKAAVYASEYLSSYGGYIEQGTTSTGSLVINFTVAGVEPSDRIGVSQIIIYKANGSRVATIQGSVSNGLLRENALIHMSSYSYNGQPGVSYYAVLTMYAERDGGSDSRTYTTNTCAAPSIQAVPSSAAPWVPVSASKIRL